MENLTDASSQKMVIPSFFLLLNVFLCLAVRSMVNNSHHPKYQNYEISSAISCVFPSSIPTLRFGIHPASPQALAEAEDGDTLVLGPRVYRSQARPYRRPFRFPLLKLKHCRR